MKVFLSNIILPLPFFWLLILLGITFFLLNQRRIGKIFLIIAISEILLFSFPWVPGFVAENLENKYTPPYSANFKEITSDTIPVLILGGGHTNDNRVPATHKLSGRALGRLTEALRLLEISGSNKLLVSGGSNTSQITHAEILRDAAISLGINPAHITVMNGPGNTREEAFYTTNFINNKQSFYLVTDAIHMPRAIYAFHQAGLNPIAAPCNYMVKKEKANPLLWWFPSSKNLEKAERAIHEYVGLLWYKLGGE